MLDLKIKLKLEDLANIRHRISDLNFKFYSGNFSDEDKEIEFWKTVEELKSSQFKNKEKLI